MSKKDQRLRVENLTIPSEADWGDCQHDLDQVCASDIRGKIQPGEQDRFRTNPIDATSDLRFMPEIPFRYYMLGFRDCVMACQFEACHDSDAASCFLGLIVQALHRSNHACAVDGY